VEVVLLILAGLGLFLYAISSLSELLQNWLGDKAKMWLSRYTSNLFSAILVGIIITTILDSSSAVIILTIILVNAKVLTFKQAIGIVMGANIGTTFSSQLLALDITKYSPIPVFIGVLLLIISKQYHITKTAKVMLYFGMLFFGLFTMETAVEPLREAPFFSAWMHSLETPLKGVLVGSIVTVIIQSSSATVGMVITLAKKGLITLAASLAVMIGAELGTCADTLLATMKGSRQALKTGLFHLIFNFCSIIIGLLLFPLFVKLVEGISRTSDIENKVANGHLIFNLLGVVFFLPFVSYIHDGLNKIFPEKKNVNINSSPSIIIE
jgi:phosphate:Na+ symporter